MPSSTFSGPKKVSQKPCFSYVKAGPSDELGRLLGTTFNKLKKLNIVNQINCKISIKWNFNSLA